MLLLEIIPCLALIRQCRVQLICLDTITHEPQVLEIYLLAISHNTSWASSFRSWANLFKKGTFALYISAIYMPFNFLAFHF